MHDETSGIDWSLTTWDGSRREQMRRWAQLTFDEILKAQEEMYDFACEMIEIRRSQGLPYIDPYTHKVVPSAAVIREEPPS